jgi:hypothetical protein
MPAASTTNKAAFARQWVLQSKTLQSKTALDIRICEIITDFSHLATGLCEGGRANASKNLNAESAETQRKREEG